MARLREPRGSDGVWDMGGTQTADRSAVSSRRVWNAGGETGAQLSLGRRSAWSVQGKLRFQGVGSFACGITSCWGKRIRRALSCGERVGVDADGVCSISRVHDHALLSRLLRKFL